MPIKFLGISVGKFEDNSESKKTRKIMDFFSAGPSKESATDGNSKQSNDANKTKVNKKADKEFILQKFFQVTDKIKIKEKVVTLVVEETAPEVQPPPEAVVTPLDKQESFFARFLNKDQKETEEPVRVTTPVCKVVECGDNSNDTDYSSSTINNEINKSIALFEEDPQDIVRVSSMRTLLSTRPEDNDSSQDIIPPAKDETIERVQSPKENTDKGRQAITPSLDQVETIECSECNKVIPLMAVDTHADYHLALKLREEERQYAREEREKKTKTAAKKVTKETKKESLKESKRDVNEANTSIASFLVKIDESKPTETCVECGKKVAMDKFPEHLDFHEAQKLSRELNRKPVPNNFSSNSVKRKRKAISPEKKPKVPCKTINSFFK